MQSDRNDLTMQKLRGGERSVAPSASPACRVDATRFLERAREPKHGAFGSQRAAMRTLLVMSALLLTASCEPSGAAGSLPSPPPTVAPPAPRAPSLVYGHQARALVASGATLLDVRTIGEFDELHLDGALNIPLHELGGALGSLRKDRPVVVYCAVGSRSATAAGFLARAGYEVHNLGAMANWNR